MVSVASVQYLGKRSGTSERGPWYQISVLADGEPFEMRCDPEVFTLCDQKKLGDDLKIYISMRRYQNNWIPRVQNVE